MNKLLTQSKNNPFGAFRLVVVALFMLVAVGPRLSYANELKVIELFTSQGCYSCPAADKLVDKMASNDPSILNLEFHVDYWNRLQYRNAGNWVDPYSSAEYSERQRRYSAMNLKGQTGVYTPQAVINGQYAHVGSNKRALNRGLKSMQAMPISVSIADAGDDAVSVTVSGDIEGDANVFFVSYLKKIETEITGGENNNKRLPNFNVVTEMQPIARLSESKAKPIKVSHVREANRGCAVLVQIPGQGPIIGAARCPY